MFDVYDLIQSLDGIAEDIRDLPPLSDEQFRNLYYSLVGLRNAAEFARRQIVLETA